MREGQMKDIKVALFAVEVIEQRLRDIMEDLTDQLEQDRARELLGFDDWVEQDDGSIVGIIYPENVDQALDKAIHDLWEAGESLRECIDYATEE